MAGLTALLFEILVESYARSCHATSAPLQYGGAAGAYAAHTTCSQLVRWRLRPKATHPLPTTLHGGLGVVWQLVRRSLLGYIFLLSLPTERHPQNNFYGGPDDQGGFEVLVFYPFSILFVYFQYNLLYIISLFYVLFRTFLSQTR